MKKNYDDEGNSIEGIFKNDEVQRIEPEKISKIISQLNNWDSLPEIVQKHLAAQYETLNSKKVNFMQEELKRLEEKLSKRRKDFLKLQSNEIRKDKIVWENEWKERIECEVDKVKKKYEKQIQELNFQKRILEISIYKRVKE